MKTTRLIQRVNKPYESQEGKMAAVANVFSFGAGLRNGGLGEKAVSLLAPIFSFDYMGAAEFEFGSVPEGLTKIVEHAKNGGVVLNEMEVKLKSIKVGWTPKGTEVNDKGVGKVWVVCGAKDQEEVMKRVKTLVVDEYGLHRNPRPDIYLKECLHLGEKLKTNLHDRLIGGLELDNGFFITIDEQAANKFYNLFTEQK